MKKKKSPKKNNIIINDLKEEKYDKLDFKLISTYNLIINHSDINMTISELRKQINKNYSLKENEYQLLIGNYSINTLSNDTLVVDLLNKYKDNNIIIKTHKNIYDLQKQIIDYENFLTKNILIKNDEISSLNSEYENIIKDLNCI